LSVLPKILPFWLVVANKKRFILLLMLRHIWKNGLILTVWSPELRPFTTIIFKLDGLCWLTYVAFPGTWPGCSGFSNDVVVLSAASCASRMVVGLAGLRLHLLPASPLPSQSCDGREFTAVEVSSFYTPLWLR
jgi:hypothetical protein